MTGLSVVNTKHPCHAPDCWRQVPAADFMCGQHWFRLPIYVRGALWAGHVAGVLLGRDHVTGELTPAAHAAIEAVARAAR